MKVFNARAHEEQEVEWSVDQNGELVATFEDNHFLKFPGDITEGELNKYLKEHNEAHQDQEVITPEVEAQRSKELEKVTKLADKLNGGTPKGDKTNAPSQTNQ